MVDTNLAVDFSKKKSLTAQLSLPTIFIGLVMILISVFLVVRESQVELNATIQEKIRGIINTIFGPYS